MPDSAPIRRVDTSNNTLKAIVCCGHTHMKRIAGRCVQVLHKRAAVIVLESTIAAEAEHRQRREASGIWPAEEIRGPVKQDVVT